MAARRDIKRSLRDGAGMSFLIALIAFLVASVVAAVIVSAAYSNVKQQNDSQEATQSMLALQSAAQLVTREIADSDCSLKITKTVTYTDSSRAQVKSTVYSYEGTGFFKTDFTNNASLKTAFDKALEGSIPQNYENGQLNISAAVGGSKKDGLTTKVTFVLYSTHQEEDADNYKLVLTFHALDSNGKETAVMNVTMTGHESDSDYKLVRQSDAVYAATNAITWTASPTYSQPVTKTS